MRIDRHVAFSVGILAVLSIASCSTDSTPQNTDDFDPTPSGSPCEPLLSDPNALITTFTVDTSQIQPNSDPEEIVEAVGKVVTRRISNVAEAADACVIQMEGNSVIVASLGASEEEIAALFFGAGLLEFKAPKVSEVSLEVVCEDSNGGEFSVATPQISEAINDSGAKESRCQGNMGESGTVVWLPATATASDGAIRPLTGAFVRPNGTEVITGMRGCAPACVSIQFTGEGGLLFEQITGKLVGKPLAIFLDGDMIGAPNVNSTIGNGEAVITTLEINEARVLASQLNSGALPAPVTIVETGSNH